MKILDCTLRDGGYYTNWDFSPELVDTYIETLNNLPIDYIEIGYRSKIKPQYMGEFFYCPDYVIKEIRLSSNKKISVMLDEKDVSIEDATELLSPIIGLVDMIRVAVNPKNLVRAIGLAKVIKKMGFEVGFNVMYMSTWIENKDFLSQIKKVDGVIDYFYMVDSYGGIYPNEVKEIIDIVKSKISTKLGFHGHNNLELGLINTLTAIDCGVDIVDATITGMGRGAGNLKTELLLTSLIAKNKIEFDFNALTKIVDSFSILQQEYEWGTNLPYMVSGANSLPQKEVMDWVGKRYYSFNSIIIALSNQSKGVKDNLNLKVFSPEIKSKKALIIGGGPSGMIHSESIKRFLEKNEEIEVIHTSSKNASPYNNVKNKQIHCLAGNEGYRLESTLKKIDTKDRIAILPPYPRVMGTYIPSFFKEKAFQLNEISITKVFKDSITAIAIQTALDMGVEEIFFVGYDGYDNAISNKELELFNENEELFKILKKSDLKFKSVLPTKYTSLPTTSLYALI
ncbi:MAG: aldolase catalytic domain-containing protein [Bacteroidota bacterium]